jgi:hypothetical protein
MSASISLKAVIPEEWRPIFGIYDISNHGRVRNRNTKQILKPQLNGKYHKVHLFANDRKVPLRICRLVAKAFIINDDTNTKTQVDHLDEDKLNDCVWNLQWVSPSENTKRYWVSRKGVKGDRSQPLMFENDDKIFFLPSISAARKYFNVCLGTMCCAVYNALNKGYKFQGYTITKITQEQYKETLDF